MLSGLVLLALVAPQRPTADIIFEGGRIFTAQESAPFAEALAISQGRVVYLGSEAGVRDFRGSSTRTFDLKGRLLVPGFIDAHTHLMTGALSLSRIDVSHDPTEAAIEAHIAREASSHRDRAWVVGFGWTYGAFPGRLPSRRALNAAVPDRPAYFESYDGHTGWANERALALAGITRGSPDPPGGQIVRGEAGDPTGVLKETATALVVSKIPKPSPDEAYALLLRALELLTSQGITGIQDARDDELDLDDEIPLFERALREGRLTLRIRAAVLMTPGHVREAIQKALSLRESHKDPHLQFGVLKGYVDGVVESHTAALLHPYSDDPSLGSGVPRWSNSELSNAVREADTNHLQVWLHAIGDRAVRMALDAHGSAMEANGKRDRRGRIEHVETIDKGDVPRFHDLGVIASMQPLHANPEKNLLEVWVKNLGNDRVSRGFAWATLERAGSRLAFGSDWPVASSDVLKGLFCALTRKTPDGEPPGGWRPEEKVDLLGALRHYTVDAAYAGFQEEWAGTLAVGRPADLVVVSQDLFDRPPEALLKTRVLLTLFEGREVYQAQEFEARPRAERRQGPRR